MVKELRKSLTIFILHLCIISIGVHTVASQYKCQTLRIQRCKGLNYNRTLFPNFENHTSQSQASYYIQQLSPLFDVNCSPDFGYFVCSYYAPLCHAHGRLVPPCRSLCESAKSGCLKVIERFGYSWPQQLNCSKFPADPKKEPCVASSHSLTTKATTSPVKRQQRSTTQTPGTIFNCISKLLNYARSKLLDKN